MQKKKNGAKNGEKGKMKKKNDPFIVIVNLITQFFIILIIISMIIMFSISCQTIPEQNVENVSEDVTDCISRYKNNRRQLIKCLTSQRKACAVLLSSKEIFTKLLSKQKIGNTIVLKSKICFGKALQKCVIVTCPKCSNRFIDELWGNIKRVIINLFSLGAGIVVGYFLL